MDSPMIFLPMTENSHAYSQQRKMGRKKNPMAFNLLINPLFREQWTHIYIAKTLPHSFSRHPIAFDKIIHRYMIKKKICIYKKKDSIDIQLKQLYKTPTSFFKNLC
jgi:hypothetical protein